MLLKLREEDKKGLESAVLANIEELVFPYLEKLKSMCLTDNQTTFLGIIEQNLHHVISPFLQEDVVRLFPLHAHRNSDSKSHQEREDQQGDCKYA